jgi:FtsP/CotA-like multicopper oxidase with cupredoxin domain
MEHATHASTETRYFSSDVTDLSEARKTEVVELADGETFELEIAPVAKRLGESRVRMLAYNGSIPGPTLKVKQGATVILNVTNHTELEATVHWHGLRLENRYDGTHETQAPIPVGGMFTYHVHCPDPGVYWFHPHIREDYGQEMGLYANIIVEPSAPHYWPPVHREIALTLDDVLLEDGAVAPFSRSETNYVAMGRFGETMLIAGETDLRLSAAKNEVVRFFLTDTANTRVFRVGLPGTKMKVVGGDSGRYEHEEFVDELVLAPSERAVVDVLFEQPGEVVLEHRSQESSYVLATIDVSDEPVESPLPLNFHELRASADFERERRRIEALLETQPDKTLAFVAEMDVGADVEVGQAVFTCPMHPDIQASWADKCPTCGMKLLVLEGETERPTAYACPMHAEVVATWTATCPKCGMTLRATGEGAADAERDHSDEHGHEHHGHAHEAPGGIEWEDDMVEVNRTTTPANMRWKIVDRETGRVNHAIDWTFRVGDQLKIRLVNEMDSDHPMHHPFHVHGAGRFLIVARDGVLEPNLVWKDTVLVRTGETVDILLDVTNPGRWMAHCHIAEHHESGMMFSFNVEPAEGATQALQ